jgi:hypothetical protein
MISRQREDYLLRQFLLVLKLRTKGSYALVTYLNTTIAAPHQKEESGATFPAR